MGMKTKQCLDCPTIMKIGYNGHNRLRCGPCAAIRKAERDRVRKREFRRLNPGSSMWYQERKDEDEYDTEARKMQRFINQLTWESYPILETPVLDGLYETLL